MVFQTKLIVAIFWAQFNKNQSRNLDFVSSFLLLSSTFKSLQKKEVEKVETMVELQTWAINDLEDLLHFKTEQINKYGYILAPKLNYYQRY